MRRYVLAAVLLSIGISCSSDIYPVKTRPLTQKNPTSYIFAGTVPDVREKILTALKDFDLMQDFYSTIPATDGFYFADESREDAVFAEEIFAKAENQDDIYLHSYGTPMLSPVYFGGGKPLKYRAEFQLHLTSAGENRTQVSIITHNAKVISGSRCCGLHGYVANEVDVEPTTVEEYRILLFLGRILGASDMPPLRLPEGK